MPFRESLAKIRENLARLSEVGWIELSEHPEQGLIGHVKAWTDHQRVDHPKDSKISTYFSREILAKLRDSLALDQGSGNRDQGRDGTNTQTRAQDAGPDYPKSLDEVLTEADMRGIPKTQAEDFFNHFESSGWIDKNGHAVKNWRAKLRTWKTIAVSAAAEKAHHGAARTDGPSPLELRPLNALKAFHARLEREEREGK